MVQSELQLQSRADRRAEASNWGDCGSDKGGLGNTDMPSVTPNPPRPPKLSNLTYDSPPDYLRTVSCPETCRVLFDYHPEAPDELALHKGDLVKVLRKTTEDKGWWEGECRGRRGVFPDNFVLPPPPIRKLIPRKIISRDISAPVKESKKLMPKTSLPSVKRPAATSVPSKAKISSTPSGDSQKRPCRDSGFNSSFLNGGPRQPGRKQTRPQAPQQHAVFSQENEQRSPGKTPSTNKSPTPNKTPLLDKTLGPEKISAPDKVSTPENPVPEKALDSDKVPTAENTTVDKAATTESALSVDEAPALVAPTEDETVDPKMALHVDSTPVLVKILTPENMLFEEDPIRDNTQCQHLPQEETTQASESPASPNDIEVPKEYSPRSNSSESWCCSKMKHGDGSPAHSRAKNEAAVEEATFLEGLPAKDETTLKEPLPKEKLPSEGAGPQKQVPPKEPVPTPQVPHANKQIPNPEETPTLHPEVPRASSKSKNDSVDVTTLKEEVGSLKSTLELLELKLEQKMNDVWEELKTEKEKLQSLEVRLTPGTQKSFKHAQTQTE
ncbi:Sh3d21 [Phodopus roborovskii]|uniref:Sh3d21 protein n=1 Tax=Phodopus roborovskii TaxID=109678 RepID=A0AAU9ZDX7_PHORO|nr:Sh3d21 [Phodopus roborovskii]